MDSQRLTEASKGLTIVLCAFQMYGPFEKDQSHLGFGQLETKNPLRKERLTNVDTVSVYPDC